MKKLTVKELRDFLNAHEISDDAEVMFEDSTGCGVHISEVFFEKVGAVPVLVLQQKDIAIQQ